MGRCKSEPSYLLLCNLICFAVFRILMPDLSIILVVLFRRSFNCKTDDLVITDINLSRFLQKNSSFLSHF